MVAISPRRAAIRRPSDKTILTLISQFLRRLQISKSESVRAALAKKGKGDSENIVFREFPALFRARASRGRRLPNAVKPVLSRPERRRRPPHHTTATTTYAPIESRNRRRSSLSVSSWSNAPSTPMSTNTITRISTIKQQYRFRISF